MTNIIFSKSIKFPDSEEEIEVEFEAVVSKGGFHYEHFGYKGFKEEYEIEEVTYDGYGLSDEQINFIDKMLDDGRLDDEIWERHNNQVCG